MAKEPNATNATNAADPVVQVPVSVLEKLTSRLEALERAELLRQEFAINPRARIIDSAYENFKAEVSRSARERTQDVADKTYGTAAPRYRVRLDSTTDEGKKGPDISEHFELNISAHSDIEAQGRYLQIMGIRKHDYRVIVVDLALTPTPATPARPDMRQAVAAPTA